jgi:hypothetical protein
VLPLKFDRFRPKKLTPRHTLAQLHYTSLIRRARVSIAETAPILVEREQTHSAEFTIV